MYLAGILALCAFATAPLSGQAVDAFQQNPQDPPAQTTSDQGQQQPDSSSQTPAAPPDSPANAQENKSVQETPKPENPPQNSGQKTVTPKSGNAAKSTNGAKKAHNSTSAATQKKKIVRKGSTGEPTTQLAPGITVEQAARQRETTYRLLNSSDNALKQLSGRQLNNDQQEAVTQIRKFIEQSKAADKDGDLQRAYKLALKAHLLSDGLVKE